jgi:hypothetical protein
MITTTTKQTVEGNSASNMVGMITSDRTYATRANAVKALVKVFGDDFPNVRWLVAVKPDGRFVPTVLGTGYIWAAHHGIMVIA